jgi:ribonuclease BN (tRNA processing enzyme)
LSIPGFEISALPLNHPGGSLAYRIRGVTGDFVYATDHEFGDPDYDGPLASFAAGAAALVLDAHFTPQELPQHRGWGHSDWRRCAEFAAAHDIGGLWLFHHKPGRSDEELVRIRTDARRIFPATETASEGDALQL